MQPQMDPDKHKSELIQGASFGSLASGSPFFLLLVLVLVLERACKTEHDDEDENEEVGIPSLG